jgi:hypothetical protein
MVYTVHFAAAVLACHLTAYALMRARWPVHSPSVAILCWQSLGLAVGLSVIGVPLSLGLAPYDMSTGEALRALVAGRLADGLTASHVAAIAIAAGVAAVLLGSTAAGLRAALRARRRHRDLLTLVARDDPAAPGALVLDHPGAAAYCVPGLRPRVVVSAGALRLLDREQIAAVLDHERAHARERHDLVLLPFSALTRAFPGDRWLRKVHESVALLIEMRADDRARQRNQEALAAALARFGTHAIPAGALGAADRDLAARVRRLREPIRPTPARAAAALALAASLAALPISLYLS